jgi:hypothetical protein
MIASKNGMVSLLYKHMHELGLQNELMPYYCVTHQRHLLDKALKFEQVNLTLLRHASQTTDS